MSTERRRKFRLEVDKPVCKCLSCGTSFSNITSILKHREYECHLYTTTESLHRLSSSSTITTSVLSDVASSTGEFVPLGNSSGQSFESTAAEPTSEAEPDVEMDTSPDLEFDEGDAYILRGYSGECFETAEEVKFPAGGEKRKRQSSEQESDVDCRPSSPRKKR